MYEFITKQNKSLRLDLDGKGVVFHLPTEQDRQGKNFRVGQSWASIHALLAKLRNDQTYAAWDRSLSIWMQDRELRLKFYARDLKLEEECRFSPEETARIMDFLWRAPNLN